MPSIATWGKRSLKCTRWVKKEIIERWGVTKVFYSCHSGTKLWKKQQVSLSKPKWKKNIKEIKVLFSNPSFKEPSYLIIRLFKQEFFLSWVFPMKLKMFFCTLLHSFHVLNFSSENLFQFGQSVVSFYIFIDFKQSCRTYVHTTSYNKYKGCHPLALKSTILGPCHVMTCPVLNIIKLLLSTTWKFYMSYKVDILPALRQLAHWQFVSWQLVPFSAEGLPAD